MMPMRPTSRRLAFVMSLGIVAVLTATQTLFGAASVMIWPIDPTIASGERATALWLENRGVQPVTVQIRVLGWSDRDYTDVYADDQKGIVASPPLATVAPGRRQLVRLTKIADVPAGQEAAFRVLVDEVPAPQGQAGDAAQAQDAAMGVTFRMRYSLPLFVYGQGAGKRIGAPLLDWRVIDLNGQRWLQVRNSGPVHAKLERVRLAAGPDEPPMTVAPGLLGYVLSGGTMRWPLPTNVPADRLLALQTGDAGQD